MTAVVSQAGPWVLLAAVIYGIYRWSQWQDAREAEMDRRFRERQAARYYEMEFEVRPEVYDWPKDAA